MKKIMSVFLSVLLLLQTSFCVNVVHAEDEVKEEPYHENEVLNQEEENKEEESEETEAPSQIEEEETISQETEEPKETSEETEDVSQETEPEETADLEDAMDPDEDLSLNESEEISETEDIENAIVIDEETKDDDWIVPMDDLKIYEDPRFGYHHYDVDPSSFAVERSSDVLDLPASYDLRDYGQVSSVKSQGGYGTCWAHAIAASAESSFLKKYGEELDLSELQLAYFNYHNIGTKDKLDLITDDGMANTSYGNLLDEGGNAYISSFMLASGMGFVDEEDLPYSSLPSQIYDEDAFIASMNEEYCYNLDDYIVTDVRWLSAADKDSIKMVLMQHGAVQVSYLAFPIMLSDGTIIYEEEVYNSETNAFYNGHYKGSNHSVTLVGWDDDFDKNNFVEAPSENGAWLIKNSWGSWWGDDGYFWISYEDVGLLSSEVCQFEIEKADENTMLYQHDGAPALYHTSFGNNFSEGGIFVSQQDEMLYRAGYVTDSDNIKVTVDVYLDVKNNPSDGTLVSSKTVNETYAGYHSVELDESIPLQKGQKYAIVISQKGSESINMCFSRTNNFGWFRTVDDISSGETFVKMNGSWKDMKSAFNGTAVVKGYTTSEIFRISYNDEIGCVNDNPGSYFRGYGNGSLELSDLQKEGYTFLGWYDAYGNRVTVIDTENDPKDYELYARWQIISYDISYDLDGGINDPSNPLTYTIEDEIVLEKPSKEGFEFIGWFMVDEAGNIAKKRTTKVGPGSLGNIRLLARWGQEEAYAVLNEQGELIFFRSFYGYQNREYYDEVIDIEENEYAGIVYSGIEKENFDASINFAPWFENRSQVRRVYVAEDQTIKPLSMTAWFASCSSLSEIDLHGFDTSEVTDFSYLFGSKVLESVDLSPLNMEKAESLYWLFAGCESLKYVTLPFGTGNVKDMSGMFYRCRSLESVDLNRLDTSGVTDISGMFAGCSDLKQIDLGSFDTSNVENFSWLFQDCESLKELDLSRLSTGSAGLMIGIFAGCAALETLDISDFDTSSVTDMYSMFEGCESLKKISLGTGFTNWRNEAYLPEGIWENGLLQKKAKALYEEYPANSVEWAGTWNNIGEPFMFNDLQDQIYTGKPITQELAVYHYETLLTEGVDYTAKYTNNTRVGVATLTVTGKGNYVGTLTKTFNILPLSVSEEDVVVLLSKDSFIYNNGKVQKPNVTSVEYKGVKLKNNTDYTVTFEDPSSAGAEGQTVYYGIDISFKGNYKGSLSVSYSVIGESNRKSISSASVSSLKALTYTGEELEQSFTVKDGKNILSKGTDYIVLYKNNVLPGTAYATIEGIGSYEGSITKTFKINGLPINKATVRGITDVYYSEEPAVQSGVKLFYGTVQLVEGKDYSISYKNNTKAGSATIGFTGMGGYTGTLNKSFKINKIFLPQKDTEVVLDADEGRNTYYYTKGGVKPLPVVTFDGKLLVLNTDYTLSYKNNTKLGTGTVTIKGKGNYYDSITESFVIKQKDLYSVNVQVPDKVYTGKVNTWKSVPVLTDTDGKKLSVGTDYEKEISYLFNGKELDMNDILQKGDVVNAVITGKGNYAGTLHASYRIVEADISKATVTIPVQYYTGKQVKLLKSEISVKLNNKILNASDYEIVSYENNIAKGTAKVTLKGTGNYGGYKTVSFKIAQRSLGITLHFDPNGATSGKMNDLVIYKDTKLPKCSLKKTVSGKDAQFLGWSLQKDGPVVVGDVGTYVYDGDLAGLNVTLYAKWVVEPAGPIKVAVMLPFRGDQSYYDDIANAAFEIDAADNGIDVDLFECDPSGETKEANWMNWFENLCEDGEYDLVVCGNASYEGFLYKACKKYPKQKFFNYDYDVIPSSGIPSNCYAATTDIAELGYAAGAMSSVLTKTGTVGVVVGMDSQGMNQFISGYCQVLTDQNIRYVINYPGSFADAALDKIVTQSQIDKGADVIWHVAGGLGNGVIAQCSEYDDVWCIGVDVDQYLQFKNSNEGWANTIITSALRYKGEALKKVCAWAADGTLDSKLGKAEEWGIKEGSVGMAENEWFLSHTSRQQRDAYQALLDKVIRGQVKVVDCMEWDQATYQSEWPKVRDGNRVE